jgi:hypothetical protein
MGIYLGVHDFGSPFSDEEMQANWDKYKESAKKHGAHAIAVYYDKEAGKSFCITKAESSDVVDQAHNDVELPTKELHQIQRLKNHDE